MKSNVLSSYRLISTGTISPPLSLVASLNLVQNSCKLIPAGPKTVPTGGAGVAFPAGICYLIFFTTSFATKNTS